MEPKERITLGKMTHPVRGFLHGSAAAGSVVGSVFLVVAAKGDLGRILSLFVFGASLVIVYTVSALYHSIPWRSLWKGRMKRLDHSMIYLLIAATYTPIALHVLDGWLRWTALVVQWGITVAGVGQKTLRSDPNHGFSVALQTTQGWLALFLLVPLVQLLPWTAMLFLALGGVSYTVGMVLLVTNRPRLWRRVFSYHEVFHVLVVAGSALHFIVMLRYVASFTRA